MLLISKEEFDKRMNEQRTSFDNLEEQITHKLEVIQYYLTNYANMQIVSVVNGVQHSFNLNQIIINQPNSENKEALFMLGTAYCGILNQFRPAHMLENKEE